MECVPYEYELVLGMNFTHLRRHCQKISHFFRSTLPVQIFCPKLGQSKDMNVCCDLADGKAVEVLVSLSTNRENGKLKNGAINETTC